MKIEKSYNSQISACAIALNALDAIQQTLIDNTTVTEEVEAAFYKIMEACYKWNNEIKKMPF